MVSFETEAIFDTGKVEKERRKWKREGAVWLCERERGKKGIRTLSVRLTSNIVVLQYYIYVFNPKLKNRIKMEKL